MTNDVAVLVRTLERARKQLRRYASTDPMANEIDVVLAAVEPSGNAGDVEYAFEQRRRKMADWWDLTEEQRKFYRNGFEEGFWSGIATEPPAQCTCQPLAQQLGVPFGLTAVAVDPECPVHREPKSYFENHSGGCDMKTVTAEEWQAELNAPVTDAELDYISKWYEDEVSDWLYAAKPDCHVVRALRELRRLRAACNCRDEGRGALDHDQGCPLHQRRGAGQ